MQFTSKQVVSMVLAVCAAVVLAPVTVSAAGQLVAIVDNATGRHARVSSNNQLQVENRVAVGSNAFNVTGSRYQFGWIPLVEATGPHQIAITKVVMSGPYDTTGNAGEVLLEAMVRTSGTLPCNGPGTAGYTRHTLQHVWVPARGTIQMDFDGTALKIPHAADGQPVCFGVTYFAGNTNMTIYAAATGYKYRQP
jgi:hypothetical protein